MHIKSRAIVYGIVVSNCLAAVILLLTSWAVNAAHSGGSGPVVFIVSEFVLLPMLIGMINAWFWKNHKVRGGQSFLLALANLAIGLFVSALFMGEGVICLVIVSPLILIFLILGITVGKVMFQRKNTTLNIGIAAAALTLMAADTVTAAPIDAKVTDTMRKSCGSSRTAS